MKGHKDNFVLINCFEASSMSVFAVIKCLVRLVTLSIMICTRIVISAVVFQLIEGEMSKINKELVF